MKRFIGKSLITLGAALVALVIFTAAPLDAHASSEPYLGEISAVGENYCPEDFAPANGQLMRISDYTSLFVLLGTTYGGDGRTTFGIPDLRGRTIKHVGSGPGLSSVRLGERGGVEAVTLAADQGSAHSHNANLLGVDILSDVGTPVSNTLAGATRAIEFKGSAVPNVELADGSVSVQINSGGVEPHDNRDPYLGLRYCIALQGIFPQRP